MGQAPSRAAGAGSRHRFATAVYQTSGRDLRTTQELMRHATPVSTAIYTWIDPADGAAAVHNLL